MGVACMGGGKFHGGRGLLVAPLEFENAAGDERDAVRDAAACSCCVCIDPPPLLKKSTLEDLLFEGGGCSASGRGDGGFNHRPLAAAVSNKLIVRE